MPSSLPIIMDDVDDVDELQLTDGVLEAAERQEAKDKPPDSFAYPRSHTPGHELCRKKYTEQDVLRILLTALRQKVQNDKGLSDDEEDFKEIDLTDFSVYLPGTNAHHAYELRSLADLGTSSGHAVLLFDGNLKIENIEYYVEGVPFDKCSIEGYGTPAELHEIGAVWLKSKLNSGSKVYYRLRIPAAEYRRFYKGFIWVANLAKHFVDYSECALMDKKSVSVHEFRENFARWLRRTHEKSSEFYQWYEEYQGDDFRNAVSMNIQFLFKECNGLEENEKKKKLRRLVIFKELLHKDFIRKQVQQTVKTIVTPYVYQCFEHMKFRDQLQEVTLKDQQPMQSNSLNGLPGKGRPVVALPSYSPLAKNQRISAIKVGDIVAVKTEEEGGNWKWQQSIHTTSVDCWYGYVQEIHTSQAGRRTFDVLWLYHPQDTFCGTMKYPHEYELFFSNHCNCYTDETEEHLSRDEDPLFEEDTLDVIPIRWHGTPGRSLFVRQTFWDLEKLVTLKDEHKTCSHKTVVLPVEYPKGQTILALSPEKNPKYELEPYEIVEYIDSESGRRVLLRKLLRRCELSVGGHHRPNELVYTNAMIEMKAENIERTCLVRFYSQQDLDSRSIPAPYDRNGTGCAFFITSMLKERICDGPITLCPMLLSPPPSLIQGFDPTKKFPHSKLKGLDFYCGGGNFGRGLEEGGAIHNAYAVDYESPQIHTYYANLKGLSATKLFHGSVNDLLYQAMKGNPQNSDLIPAPGNIDFISAGSSCQGFSKLNSLRNNEKGLRNQSMVASVAAYIDFYRPKYGMLENVLNISQRGDDDVLSQLICCIVGLGYQVSIFVLQPCSTGSAQSRGRLFVSFTASGLEPIEHPGITHRDPIFKQKRSVGKLANGCAVATTLTDPTPFHSNSASDSVSDLDDIGNGLTFHCIRFPDHVLPRRPGRDRLAQIAAIPTQPRGSDFASAWFGLKRPDGKRDGKGVMTKEQRALFPTRMRLSENLPESVKPESKAWGRVRPDRLFGAVITSEQVRDARMGNTLHWDQDRVLTIMESRRAQGFPDTDVLVGGLSERLKIVGNSVDRSVALSLGLAVRNAWMKTFSTNGNQARKLDTSPPVLNTGSSVKARDAAARSLPIISRNGFVNLTEILDQDECPVERTFSQTLKRSSSMVADADITATRTKTPRLSGESLP
ncbi:S-adenosyl-L-methionine-dependent methyltransferase [Calycina marina]|uniref:DNA (cytosine-5-)-methyltransferase n=1 Tax=Calycina marina TaxID=1763456 RepID=A0A9P7Z6D2_9HELO|nr:S-adenosyl-L-methionine-dependent methyltransferase [Calycina marina]